ncbi:MAG: alpha/beta fold hydrolase [Candidatus Moranbacteria bacterium]|nr:alpha/beta fold hydrolase [Candidatus Moranbacteria bacterium]
MENKVIKFETPKKFLLNGMFFGSEKAENIFICLHGLGANLFSQVELAKKIADKKNSVLVFNNRGNGIISRIHQFDKKNKKYISREIGMAHEVFTDCVDDIEGAVQYAKTLGDKNIFLLGHSTGCQKSVYYLAKNQKTAIKGVLLLAPMSDFADTFAFTDRKLYNKAVSFANKLVAEKRQHELLPEKIWPSTIDAQRFLSLFTADSVEEIFSYASNRNPKLLQSVKLPKLIVLAENDEYRDREISKIADWFKENLQENKAEIITIKNAPHNFQEHIDELAKVVKTWVEKLN